MHVEAAFFGLGKDESSILSTSIIFSRTLLRCARFSLAFLTINKIIGTIKLRIFTITSFSGSRHMVFVKARTGPANAGDPKAMFTVQYFDEDGNMTIRSGGTRAWRCNNPGNLLKSHYSMSKKRRAIGFAGDEKDEYAVYPDKETGREALIVMLLGSVTLPRRCVRLWPTTSRTKETILTLLWLKQDLIPKEQLTPSPPKSLKVFVNPLSLLKGGPQGGKTSSKNGLSQEFTRKTELFLNTLSENRRETSG